MFRTAGARIALLIEDGDRLLARGAAGEAGALFHLGGWTEEVVRGLRGLDGDEPLPLFVAPEKIAAFGLETASARHAPWAALRESQDGGRPFVTSLYLRLARDDGMPTDETFLRFLSGRFFGPPQLAGGGTISPEEVERMWEAGADDFLLTTYFEADVHELARGLDTRSG